MIGLLQRVRQASVHVDGVEISRIGHGLMVLVCAERGDTEKEADLLLKRLVNYRVFPDDCGRMNQSLSTIGADLMLVPQFTLAADTKSGTRPSFSPAAPPDEGKRLFDYMAEQAKALPDIANVATGRFGANMQVSLTNDGPVTFWLETPRK
ncbi:MAG: D-tyrosyl-tRNA(Tyr) deacylase [Oxalobacter sp.]|nr:D-tyrosyl-tRNA(Tyr) deacylase [Oxalobacter sp.]MBR6000077.1 D-tyrosyl-tRNA(Tyr) deacylase [Oxalobacter sp.]